MYLWKKLKIKEIHDSFYVSFHALADKTRLALEHHCTQISQTDMLSIHGVFDGLRKIRCDNLTRLLFSAYIYIKPELFSAACICTVASLQFNHYMVEICSFWWITHLWCLQSITYAVPQPSLLTGEKLNVFCSPLGGAGRPISDIKNTVFSQFQEYFLKVILYCIK